MAVQESLPESTQASSQGGKKARRPEGYRWLSILLPQRTFNNLHIQARLSDMSFQLYMEKFLGEAFPYDGSSVSQGRAPEQARSATG